jgi:hypothetical protein
MRTLFTLLFVATAVAVSAQNKPAPASISPKPKFGKEDVPLPILDAISRKITSAGNLTAFLKSFPDTIVIGGESAPIDNMPNAISSKAIPPVYKGNNGRGFDIYESQLDGMPVLMPDSANKASLNNGSVKKSQGVYQMPGNRLYLVPRTQNYRYPKN